MPQVSKRPLDKDIEHEIFRQFWLSISRLNTPREVSQFFSDILSDLEEQMIAKRYAIAMLLLKHKSHNDIASVLHVSYSKIGSVAAWLRRASPTTVASLRIISNDQKWQGIMDTIDALLDEIPPRYGTDWSRKGKEKFRRKQKRSARKAFT